MAKNMAQIKNGKVISVGWWANKQPETENLINIENVPVQIDDIFDEREHRFYRNGKIIKTDTEKQIEKNTNAINDNVSALCDLGDATESNTADSESALAELADMYASIDERITALETAKGE